MITPGLDRFMPQDLDEYVLYPNPPDLPQLHLDVRNERLGLLSDFNINTTILKI